MFESFRMQSVQSPIIPTIGGLIQQNPGTISLGQGVVSYGPPLAAIERISEFLANPEQHKYQAVEGIPELLKAIETKLQLENNVTVDAQQQVFVTAGSNMGFMNAVMAIADPGDEIILQTPYYFNHEMAVRMANCVPVLVQTNERYQLRLDAIQQAITPKTRAIVTISPNNPTGAVYPEADLRAVNTLCRNYGLYHIHDEAYEYFTYDDAQHFSPAAILDSQTHTISLFSLSKAYGFASWRIGYMLIPAHLSAAIKKIQDTILICAAVVSQHAAVGALQTGMDYFRPKLAALAQVRKVCLDHLSGIQDICHVPTSNGAFYFLLNVNSSIDSFKFASRLIHEYNVAVIPGNTFGMTGCYLRVAYGALQQDTVAEGMSRLVRGIREIVQAS